MTSARTVKYAVRFGPQRRLARADPQAALDAKTERALRQIALGVAIERAVAEGKVASYAEAARMLGVSRVQVMKHVHLAGSTTRGSDACDPDLVTRR